MADNISADFQSKGIGNTFGNVRFSANKYQGQELNGRPHGYGTMIYGDGKRYEGEFANGLRHGQGTLTMPNGESFKGQFINDAITENGAYYDENGRPRNIHYAKPKAKSLGSVVWDKTWRLLVSALCFGMAALSAWAVVNFFESGKGGVVRVGGFVAPVIFGWWGLKNLVLFFVNLFSNQRRAA